MVGDVCCLALELVHGSSLHRMVQEKGALAKSQVLHISYQVLQALLYLHEQKHVHGDLKPENILICRDHKVKLTDFGCCIVESDTSVVKQINAGSPAFQSPELIMGEESDAAQVEVWSFGLVFYFASFGKLPFAGDNLLGLLDDIAAAKVEIPDDADSELKTVLKSTLVGASERLSLAELSELSAFQSVPQDPDTTGWIAPVVGEVSQFVDGTEPTKYLLRNDASETNRMSPASDTESPKAERDSEEGAMGKKCCIIC